MSKAQNHTRNVWLFSPYLGDIRVRDVLKIRWSDIYYKRIQYGMNKNAKLVSLKLLDKLNPIMEFWRPDMKHTDDFVFPELKKADLKNDKDIYAKTNTATKKFNKYLPQIVIKSCINKKVAIHIARHSFGNVAGDQIPIQMLQKLYRHSSITTIM